MRANDPARDPIPGSGRAGAGAEREAVRDAPRAGTAGVARVHDHVEPCGGERATDRDRAGEGEHATNGVRAAGREHALGGEYTGDGKPSGGIGDGHPGGDAGDGEPGGSADGGDEASGDAGGDDLGGAAGDDEAGEPFGFDAPIRRGDPVTRAALAVIRGYKLAVSPLMPPACRFVPTCSEYGYEAVAKYGIIKGGRLAIWRVLRCNPFGRGGYDPVP